MKIIKHGKLHENTRVIKCSCECEFEVGFNDYKDNKMYSSTLNTFVYRVHCPECGRVFHINTVGDDI